MVAAIVFAPLIWKVAINDIDFTARLKGPSWAHPFGTDDLGQDLLARMLYGGRISIAVGLASMVVAIVVGTIIGAVAGMSRRWVGPALMWVTDLFLSLPTLPVLLLVILSVPRRPQGAIRSGGRRVHPDCRRHRQLALDAAARLVRAQFLSLREKEFVEAARALGASKPRIVVRHILPNALGPVIVAATIDVAAAIIAEFDALVPRPRLSARHTELGPHPVRRQGLSRLRAVLGAVSRRRHLPDGVVDPFRRRWPARRARSAQGGCNARETFLRRRRCSKFAASRRISQPRTAWCRPSTASISRSAAAKRWAWSASAVREDRTAISVLRLIAFAAGQTSLGGQMLLTGAISSRSRRRDGPHPRQRKSRWCSRSR